MKLNSKVGSPLFHFDTVKSTNDIAKVLAEQGCKEGTCILADFQTKGRGQSGRIWESPDGENLYLSVIFKPQSFSNITLFGLLAACAVHDTFTKHKLSDILIKWPNDIIVNTKKICGILCEMRSVSNKPEFVVVGIGINLNSDLTNLSKGLEPHVTSLSLELKKNVNKLTFLNDLFGYLDLWYQCFQNKEYSKITNKVNQHLYKKDELVFFKSTSDSFHANLKGVNSNGGIILVKNAKESSFETGEIRIIAK